MNKYYRAVSVNLIYFVINTFIFIIITAIAIRVMGEVFYGLWSILNAILLFCGGVLGLDVVVNKFTSEAGENSIKLDSILTAGVILLLPAACLIALILMVSREWIAARLGININFQQQISLALVFSALSVFPQFLGRIPAGYLLSRLKNGWVRVNEMGVNFAMWIGAIIIVVFTKNLVWIALWGLIVQTIGALILFKLVMSMTNWKWSVEISAIWRMLNYSFFGFIENIATVLFQQFDRILVGIVIGPAAAGVYSVGTSVGLRQTTITGQVTEIMIPYASLHDSLGNREKLYKNFRKLVNYVSISIAALSSFLIIWMPEILSLWLGPTFAEKYAFIFRILVLGYGLFTLCHPGRQTLMGIGKVKHVAITYLISSIIMLTAVYFLSKWLSLPGAACADGVMAALILFNIFSYDILNDGINWAHVISDMFLGIFIPVCTFFLVTQINTPIIIKFITSLIILIILLRVFLKTFPEARQFINRFSKNGAL